MSSNKLINKRILFLMFLLIGAYFGLVLQTNFPINDDWLFVRQVQAFRTGKFAINHQIEPSFIVQASLGYLWSFIFGTSFVSLHTLTFLVYLLSGVILYKLLNQICSNSKLNAVATSVFMFNPIVLASSYTFMTEIYTLFFMLSTLYLYQEALNKESTQHFFLASVFSGLGFMVRQSALAVYGSAIVIYFLKTKRSKLLEYVISFVIVSIFVFIWKLWPSYSVLAENPRNIFIESQNVPERVRMLQYSLIYFAFFLLPFLPYILKFLKDKISVQKNQVAIVAPVIFLATAGILTICIFNHDIFPVGNVLYIEGLYAKSDFRSNLSVFDNIPVKILFSFITAVSMLALIVCLYLVLRKKVRGNHWLIHFYLFTFILNFGLMMVSKDLYDRYLLPAFVSLLIIFVIVLKEVKFEYKKLLIFTVGIYVFISLSLNFEFVSSESLKWEQSRNIQHDHNIYLNIYLNGTYTKYTAAAQSNDFMGIDNAVPGGIRYTCYIQQYTEDGKSLYAQSLEKMETQLENYIQNPRIYMSTKDEEIKRIKKHTNELEYNQMYFSPLYSIIGKKAYVGSWCD